MGGDACSKGREFESKHRILDGHLSYLFVVKNVMCVWKTKINEKEAGVTTTSEQMTLQSFISG